MSKISECLRNSGKQAGLIPFITAGFPYADSTVPMLQALANAGADVIELGVPFSDPMADGSAIQRANEVALANHINLRQILTQVAAFRRDNTAVPIVLMGYTNSFINYGDTFAADAADAGVNGVIIVDMADSDREHWRQRLDAAAIDLIALMSPTTAPERMQEIAAVARGFLYFISMRGITGARALQLTDITAQVQTARAMASVPIAIGFGVRNEEQVRHAAAQADAVVIGSRLIEIAEENYAEAPAKIAEFIQTLVKALQ